MDVPSNFQGKRSYHRYPPYFQPSRGRPVNLNNLVYGRSKSRVLYDHPNKLPKSLPPSDYLLFLPLVLNALLILTIVRRGRYDGVSPLNRPDGVSPLNRPDGVSPLTHPDKVYPLKTHSNNKPVPVSKNIPNVQCNWRQCVWFDEDKVEEAVVRRDPLPAEHPRRRMSREEKEMNTLLQSFSRLTLQELPSPLMTGGKRKMVEMLSTEGKKMAKSGERVDKEVEGDEGKVVTRRRRVWRRKQGNSSAQREGIPSRRRLQRLPEISP